MKYILYTSVLFLLILSACTKEASPQLKDNPFVPETSDSLVATASFVSDVHPTSGSVMLYVNDSSYTLSFTDFQSDNGPDLRVYLSADLGDSDFVDLGELLAVTGNFSYSFPRNTDTETYNNVLIWCEDFSVLFGHASFT